MPMWRYRLTDLLRREYWRLEMPAALAAESHYRRNWNLFLDRHYRRKWNVRVSKVMDNATHVAMYFGVSSNGVFRNLGGRKTMKLSS